MTAVLKPTNRDRLSHAPQRSNRADVIPFPTSARTRRERQQLAQQQLAQQQSAPKQFPSKQFVTNAAPSGNGSRSIGMSPGAQPTVRSLPNRQALPAWLKWLMMVHRTSSIVTCGLVAAALTIYGWTVQTQQVWGRDYQRLEKLQQQERQIVTASEVLKHQLALQAEDPTTELTQATPENAIFLEPAPPRPAPVVIDQHPPNILMTKPLGY
jgi:hypothetical protein